MSWVSSLAREWIAGNVRDLTASAATTPVLVATSSSWTRTTTEMNQDFSKMSREFGTMVRNSRIGLSSSRKPLIRGLRYRISCSNQSSHAVRIVPWMTASAVGIRDVRSSSHSRSTMIGLRPIVIGHSSNIRGREATGTFSDTLRRIGRTRRDFAMDLGRLAIQRLLRLQDLMDLMAVLLAEDLMVIGLSSGPLQWRSTRARSGGFSRLWESSLSHSLSNISL